MHVFPTQQLSKDLPDDKFLSYVSIKATEKLQALENDVFKPNKTNDLSKQLIGAYVGVWVLHVPMVCVCVDGLGAQPP